MAHAQITLPRPSRFHWLATTIALAGMSMLVYQWRLSKPLWVDEEMIALNARWRPFGDLAGALWLDQSAPLGWMALERLALLAFGIDERAARVLPTLCGLGTLGVAIWIGRRWMTAAGAAILAALCAIGPWLVFFTLELKQYSADTCFALLLPALVAWATEGATREAVIRRATAWWITAAAGLWLSNGATFVAPACAMVLAGRSWQRYGWRDAVRVALPGFVWLASFGTHYVLALRPALDNAYLRTYWSFAFPPVSDGVFATLRWTRHWFESFAVKPAGTSHWLLFWTATIVGYVYATVRYGALGMAYAAVPLSALTLGIFHVIPPFERLGLWCVPALYVGIGLCADAAQRLLQSRGGPPLLRVIAMVAALSAAGYVSLDIVQAGRGQLGARAPDNNYGLDDSRAVRRVLGLRRPGDPVLTTHFGLAGLWWYADVDISDEHRGGYLDDSPIFEILHEPRSSQCDRRKSELDAVLARTGRVVVYLGFRLNVLPDGFDKFALDELSKRGAMVGYRRYAHLRHVAAFDFKQPPDGDARRLFDELGNAAPPPLSGCLAIRPARRW